MSRAVVAKSPAVWPDAEQRGNEKEGRRFTRHKPVRQWDSKRNEIGTGHASFRGGCDEA